MSKIAFPVAIQEESTAVYSVTVPNLPGCTSFGETIEDALAEASDAIENHLYELSKQGLPAGLKPATIDALYGLDEFRGAVWAMVEYDPSPRQSRPFSERHAARGVSPPERVPRQRFTFRMDQDLVWAYVDAGPDVDLHDRMNNALRTYAREHLLPTIEVVTISTNET
jgi:predicted RNase H-like HicB family nuclease/uncharacterized protein (DUF4415 family)